MKLITAIVCSIALLSVAACDVFVSSETRIERAREAIAMGDYGRAEIELRNVVQDEPQNHAALARLVEALIFQSDLIGAEAQLAVLRKLGPLSPDTADLVARLYVEKKDFAGLKAALTGGELPLGETLALRESQLLLAEGKLLEANAKLSAAIEARPADLEVQVLRAMTVAALGNTTQARRDIDVLLAKAPTNAHAWVARSGMVMTINPLEALQNLEKATQNAGGQLTYLEQAGLLSTMTEQYLALGNVPAAEVTAGRLSALLPGSHLAILVTAEISNSKGDYGKAVTALQELLGRQPDFAPARLPLGKALAAQGNLRQAEAELERLVASAPANISARKTLADVLLKLKNPIRALQVLAPVLNEGTDAEVARLSSDAQMTVAGSSSDRERLLSLLKSEPDNEPLRLLTAGVLSRAAEHRAVIDLLGESRPIDIRRIPLLLNAVAAVRGLPALGVESERLVAMQPGDPRIPSTLGIYFAGRNDFATAAKWFDRALDQMDRVDVKAADLRNAKWNLVKLLAGAHVRLGEKAAALAALKRFPSTGDNDVTVLLLTADINMELRDYAEAATGYSRAFENSPTAQTVMKLAQARALARLPDASRPLESWLNDHPADNPIRMMLAEMHQSSGQSASAIKEYEAVLALQPAHVLAMNNLAWLYHEQQDKRALDLARQAYEKSARVPEIADTYGWILLSAGREQESVPILAAAAAGSVRPVVQYHYAVALARTGSLPDARQRLAKLLAEAGDFDERAEAERTLAEWNRRS